MKKGNYHGPGEYEEPTDFPKDSRKAKAGSEKERSGKT